jgi:hypothetical protein
VSAGLLAVFDALDGNTSTLELRAQVIKARAAVEELMLRADTAATALSNLISAGQVNEGYSGYVTDLTDALARCGAVS